MTLLLFLAVTLGGVTQRLTGMGLALVSVPLIVVAVGPGPGAVIGNLFGAVASAIVFFRVRKIVEWRLLAVILPAGLIGVAAGTVVAELISIAWAQVVVGGLVLISIPMSSLVARMRPAPRTISVLGSLALVSGTTSSLAGIGGPAMAVMRNLTRWDPVAFAATLQPFFMVVGSLSVAARVSVDPGVWPDLGALWVGIPLALFAGLVLGDFVARRMTPRAVTLAISTVASLGAAWTLVRGLMEV